MINRTESIDYLKINNNKHLTMKYFSIQIHALGEKVNRRLPFVFLSLRLLPPRRSRPQRQLKNSTNVLLYRLKFLHEKKYFPRSRLARHPRQHGHVLGRVYARVPLKFPSQFPLSKIKKIKKQIIRENNLSIIRRFK